MMYVNKEEDNKLEILKNKPTSSNNDPDKFPELAKKLILIST